VFTARYAPSSYIKQIRFVFKGLKLYDLTYTNSQMLPICTQALQGVIVRPNMKYNF
jgi:hypothetical protein